MPHGHVHTTAFVLQSRPVTFKGREGKRSRKGAGIWPPTPPPPQPRVGGGPAARTLSSTPAREGAGQLAPGLYRPPIHSNSLQQRRLQAFVPTGRDEPKSPPTKGKARPDRIFPEIGASQYTIPNQSGQEASSSPRVASFLRRNNAETIMRKERPHQRRKKSVR